MRKYIWVVIWASLVTFIAAVALLTLKAINPDTFSIIASIAGFAFFASSATEFTRRRTERFADIAELEDAAQQRSEKIYATVGTIILAGLLVFLYLQMWLVIAFGSVRMY
ncbi:hypothetical protein [Rhodoluna sp.]|uniref:hypothetical protein n=1 Tax=Rhodoluna sp. TaxID=1969481 RepID=UPI0025F39BC1|nr:hypothetical protein [Rhodoluna sp.]